MEIPFELRTALERILQDADHGQLFRDSQNISLRYRTRGGTGERLLTSDGEALSYAISRMPATYGAVRTALEKTLACVDCRPRTLLDAGAGTGAASWAAASLLDLDCVACLEREMAMRSLGARLMEDGVQVLRKAKWIEHDLGSGDILKNGELFNNGKLPDNSGLPENDEFPENGSTLGKADLVIASYVLNEMAEDARKRTVRQLWESTGMILLLVEPGTPTGYSHLKEVRNMLIEQGAFIAAPCPHSAGCPMETDDWCHFTCRVPRSRLHRQLKDGEAPYEDEKFSYTAFVRETCSCGGMRILRHPQVRGGHVMLRVCTQDGIKDITLTKKDGESYKKARKAVSGDELD
ncbi:MAG: rRNA methyltransferase [Clostridiaceae bacterium]|jgi:ribosomal protein RSM22 (predicted rRNA methylase)|nr:rRNA methyltransferase [Clostridiaceae bacterium]